MKVQNKILLFQKLKQRNSTVKKKLGQNWGATAAPT
jgi:hypothetical protein